jgi:hypothetical protein
VEKYKGKGDQLWHTHILQHCYKALFIHAIEKF